MATTQCPTCKRFGSSKLDGYCKTHYTGKVKESKSSKHILDDFYEKAESSGEFFPSEFGIISDKFGAER